MFLKNSCPDVKSIAKVLEKEPQSSLFPVFRLPATLLENTSHTDIQKKKLPRTSEKLFKKNEPCDCFCTEQDQNNI